MTDARRTRKPKAEKANSALSGRLAEGLSTDELPRVLACALQALDEKALEKLVDTVGTETGKALSAILKPAAPAKGKAPPRSASSARIRQEWDEAWSRWNECIWEAAEEDGRYVEQEHHWEPPYLDTCTLSSDLEEIAKTIRPLIRRVHDEDLEPGFSFADTLVAAVEEVSDGLPEWMDGSMEDWGFGPTVTGCLLESEWLLCRRSKVSAYELAQRIADLETGSPPVPLDGDAIERFVKALGAADKAELFRGIADHRDRDPWAELLSLPHNHWFKVFQALGKKEDPELHLDLCRSNIKSDWQLALPVLSDLLRRKEHERALELAGEAVSSLLLRRGQKRWEPGESLLVLEVVFRLEERSSPPVLRLLADWRKAAQALGKGELGALLDVQVRAGKHPFDWTHVLGAFAGVPREFQAAAGSLFASWRRRMVRESQPSSGGEVDESETWVGLLLDAARAGEGAGPTFRRELRAWLEDSASNREVARKRSNRVAVLTLDLDRGSNLREGYPKLHAILRGKEPCNKGVTHSRRDWLKRLGAASLMPDVLRFWKRTIAVLRPQLDPPKYQSSAAWLAAVYELDRERAERTMRDWTGQHRRKKNLWSEVARQGIKPAGDAPRGGRS